MINTVNGMLEDLGAELGPAATLRLVSGYGGTNIKVPRKARADHYLANLLGMQALEALCNGWGGEVLYVPLNEYAAHIAVLRGVVRMVEEGRSAQDIAHVLEVTERTVFRMKLEARQLGLLTPVNAHGGDVPDVPINEDVEHIAILRVVSRMVEEGRSAQDIALMLGVGKKTVLKMKLEAMQLRLLPE